MENTASLNDHHLKEDIEDYIETKVDILKLKTIDKTGSALSSAIVGVAAAVLGLFILQFLSFAAAYAIGYVTGHYSIGFLCVAGFYILLTVLIFVFKEKFVTIPIINTLLKKFYHNTDKS